MLFLETIQTDDVKRATLDRISPKMSDTANLMTKLPLAVNCMYHVIVNVDVDDGIVNGADCIVKKFQFLTNSKIPSIVWVEFDDKTVGHHMRQKYHSFFTAEIPNTWTPIFAIQRTFCVGRNHTSVARKQFPLAPASFCQNYSQMSRSHAE
jgi:hypothetical protein